MVHTINLNKTKSKDSVQFLIQQFAINFIQLIKSNYNIIQLSLDYKKPVRYDKVSEFMLRDHQNNVLADVTQTVH